MNNSFNILDCFDDNIDNLDITKKYVYVLKLIDDRYYVGRTSNILRRINQHFTGIGAKYTKKFKPIKVIDIILELTRYDEKMKTLEMMEKYGWEKVRGACWCSLDILKPSYINNSVCWLKNLDNYENNKIEISNKIENKKEISIKNYNNKMESPMLKMIRGKTPNVNYPSNLGQRWTDEEEKILLEELDKNLDIELIAEKHNRTTGGINARRREIAYKLYSKNISIEEIINKTRLNRNEIYEIIKRRNNRLNSKQETKKDNTQNIKEDLDLKNEMREMRNEINELKKTIKELIGMMNAVYEFEDT